MSSGSGSSTGRDNGRSAGRLDTSEDNVAYYDGTRREVETATADEQARQEWLAETRAALDYINGPGG